VAIQGPGGRLLTKGAWHVYDLILRNGCLITGDGSARFNGDLAVEGGRIAAIGDLGAAQARNGERA
jgi:N-acyl-D-aspartate/D-glutamate deacylase